MSNVLAYKRDVDSIEKTIIEMEKAALKRWNAGDPSGFLDISSRDIVYFDPMTAQRLDGLERLTELYESVRGRIMVHRFEMINPKVQATDNMAVLTFNLISYVGEIGQRWNCTEVYRLEDNEQWRIIQTHWSITAPNFKL
jgi:ketosteroid isomerase-like protein